MNYKKVFQNTAWQIFGRLVMVAVSVASVAILTRQLGAGGYGDFVLLTGLVLLFFNLADFGIGTTAIKRLTRQPQKKNLIFSQTAGLKLVFTIFSALLLVSLAAFMPQLAELRLTAAIGSLTLFFLNLRGCANIFFLAESRLLEKVIFEIINSLLFILGLAITPQLSLTTAILLWIIAAAFSGITAFIFLVKQKNLPIKISFKNFKSLLIKSAPIGTRQLVFATYDFAIDSLFLKTFLTSVSVGYYGLAYKIYTNLVLVAAFFMNSLFPSLIKQKHTNLKKQLFFGGKVLFSAALVIFIGLQFFAPLIVKIIAGEQFHASIAVLKILGVALVFAFLNHLLGYTLIAQNHQKALLYFSLVSLLVNLVGNALFVPHFGIIAAAWVTVATEGVIFFLSAFFVSQKFILQKQFNSIK